MRIGKRPSTENAPGRAPAPSNKTDDGGGGKPSGLADFGNGPGPAPTPTTPAGQAKNQEPHGLPHHGPSSEPAKLTPKEVREQATLLSKQAEELADKAFAVEEAGGDASALYDQADALNEQKNAQQAKYKDLTGFEVDDLGKVNVDKFTGDVDLTPIEYLKSKGAKVTEAGHVIMPGGAPDAPEIDVADLTQGQLGEIVTGMQAIDAKNAAQAKIQADMDYISDVLGVDVGGMSHAQIKDLVNANSGKFDQAALRALVGDSPPGNISPEMQAQLDKKIETVPGGTGVGNDNNNGGGVGGIPANPTPGDPHSGDHATPVPVETPKAPGAPGPVGGGVDLAPAGAEAKPVYTATGYETVTANGVTDVTIKWTVTGAGSEDGEYFTQYIIGGAFGGTYGVFKKGSNEPIADGEGKPPTDAIVGQSTTETDAAKKEALFATGGVGKKKETSESSEPESTEETESSNEAGSTEKSEKSEKSESTEETGSTEETEESSETESSEAPEAATEEEDVDGYTPGPDGEEMTPEEHAAMMRQMGLAESAADYLGRKIDDASFDTKTGSDDSTPDPTGGATGGDEGADVYQGGTVDPGTEGGNALPPGYVTEETMQAVYEAEKGGGVTDPED